VAIAAGASEGQGQGTRTCSRTLSVGVLVLNYNTWDLALRSLHAAIALEGGKVKEYVLFDDGSAEPPPAPIDSPIRLIRGGGNRGFAKALGAAFAAMGSDIVVLFDSDAYPLTPFSDRVRELFEQDAALGQLGFRAQDAKGKQTESYLGEPTQWSLVLGQALYARVPKRPLRPSRLCVITGCMATRMAAHRDVGGFDEGFEFLDVDLDYSMRLRRGGWSVKIDPSIRVFHLGGGTQLQRNRVLLFYKNRWRLLRKHGLLSSPPLARASILARLRCEEKILRLFGRCMFKSRAVLEDKILGRKAIVSYCETHYR